MANRSKKKGTPYNYNRGDNRGPSGGMRQSASVPRSNPNYHNPHQQLEGIYRNKRMVYNLTSLIGCKVEAELSTTGDIYVGVLRTVSPQMDFVLELACKKPSQGQVLSKSSLLSTLVLRWNEISKVSVIGVVASSQNDIFKTDMEIGTQLNGHYNDKKELEPFEFDSNMPELLGDKDDEGGWNAEEMFVTNERKFKVASSFNSEMTEYTTPLVLSETDQSRIEQAERKAREIEMGYTEDNHHIDDDGTEEELFSSVVRSPEAQLERKSVDSNAKKPVEEEVCKTELKEVKEESCVSEIQSMDNLKVNKVVGNDDLSHVDGLKSESGTGSVEPGNESVAKDESGNESVAKDESAKDKPGNESVAKDESGNESVAKDESAKDKPENESVAKDESGNESVAKDESGNESVAKDEPGNKSVAKDESGNEHSPLTQKVKFKLNPDAQEFKPSQSPSSTAGSPLTHSTASSFSNPRPQRQKSAGIRHQQPRSFPSHDQINLYNTGYRMMHPQAPPIGGPPAGYVLRPSSYGSQLVGNQAFYSIPTSLPGTPTHAQAILSHPNMPHAMGVAQGHNMVYVPVPYNQPYAASLGPAGLLSYPQPQGGGTK